MTGAEILTRFTADTSGVDKATSGFNVGLGKLASAFTIANVAAQAINKTISVFTSNLDSAISRFDTMNNFPKVMSNLGIGSDEAQASIDKLSEKLQGLPTSLDSAAMAVQRFTSANSDVDKSTDMFLALNNAILAGGASSDIQSSALEQISQAYAKGKPDMMEWRTMMMAMPAQLKQVASAMGYVSADALGESLRDGTTSMDEFMNTIMQLNTNGVGDFLSFEEQAKNSTGGIATNITNMKTAITRGITNMIGSVDEALEPFGGLSGVISKIGKIGEKVFTTLGKAIGEIIPVIINVVNFFKEHKVLMGALVGIISSVVAALTIYKTIMTVINTIQAIQNALLLANPAVLIITAIVAAIAGLVAAVLWLWNNCEGFRNIVMGIFDAIKNALITVYNFFVEVITGLWNFLQPIFDLIKNAILLYIIIVTTVWTAIWNILKGIATWIWNNVLSPVFNFVKGVFEKIWGIISGVVDKIKKAFKVVKDFIINVFNAVKGTITHIFSTIGNIIKTPINAIIGGINKVIDKINQLKIPDWVPVIGGQSPNFKKIPQLNVGTNYVPQDTLAMIHKGEAVVPKKFNPYANGVRPQTIGTMNASTPSVNVVVNANFETDPLGQMVSKIKTFSGGAKNDYNYGMGVR